MKKLFALSVLFLIATTLFAQKLHSPAEILQIMSDSKLSFEIKQLEKEIPCPDLSEKLNYHDSYRVTTDSTITTYRFKFSKESKPPYDKAEQFFSAHQADSALVYYEMAIKADSTLSNVMTYIGQIYEGKEERSKAIEWYRKAIRMNFIDYMAHWFLADNLLAIDSTKEAVQEIVIAQILNRNNPRIKKSLANIFEHAFLNTTDWCFNPQMELSKPAEGKVSISFTDKWTGFAMAKALWTYEPGYRESMGVANGHYSTIEDKECLISLLFGLENAKIDISKERQLVILKAAAENNYLQEYILYEVVLPKTPFVAYQLSEKTILGIKDYILKFRNKD
jgi:tetratricopeptide (TPR) repeat protein